MKVVFDTDPGIDDAMALLYLHGSEILDLLGITTVTGNAAVEQCTRNALYLCEQFNIDVPVYAGAEGNVAGRVRTEFPDFVHGRNGLADIDVKTSRRPAQLSASEYLSDVARRHPGEVTIIAVGQLTNVALAIRADAAFARQVREIIFMGGACHCEGNVSRWAEANAAGDPEAAAIVFGSGIPLTLVGLDVTMQTRMTPAYIDLMCEECPGAASFLRAVTAVYGDHYRTEHGLEAFPVHDASAVACAEAPQFFTMERGLLDCVRSGDQLGRTLFLPDLSGPHRVCLGVDSERLLQRYREVLAATYGAPGEAL